MNSNIWFFTPLFLTKTTIKSTQKFIKKIYSDTTKIHQKQTYVAFSILKLKFTKFEFFVAQNYCPKIDKNA